MLRARQFCRLEYTENIAEGDGAWKRLSGGLEAQPKSWRSVVFAKWFAGAGKRGF